MKDSIKGIHHITAISGRAQENADFYAGALGLRFVKRTVNFDDPGTYHLYYGDAEGRPGSILTFFPWAYATSGRSGAGMAEATAFAVPAGSLAFWSERLDRHGVKNIASSDRFGGEVLALKDPHGLDLELAADPNPPMDGKPWGIVDPAFAIRGFAGVTLLASRPETTAALMTGIFGYEQVAEEDGRIRLRAKSTEMGGYVDLVKRTDTGRLGVGTVHHVAFRARDEEQQLAWREEVQAAGLFVTEVKDRNYFKSIYFREPNGVLFEIATDPPGFTADEPMESLGHELKLPKWLEPRRTELQEHLGELNLPYINRGAVQADG